MLSSGRFQRSADNNDRLLVVGGGPEEEYLKGLVKELQLENKDYLYRKSFARASTQIHERVPCVYSYQ